MNVSVIKLLAPGDGTPDFIQVRDSVQQQI